MTSKQKHGKQEKRSQPSATELALSEANSKLMEELKLLQHEFSQLQSETHTLVAEAERAPPAAAAQAVDPINSVLQTVTSLLPVVGPLLAFL